MALAMSGILRGADDLSRFNRVRIEPSSVQLYIASVSMSFSPFVRSGATLASTYEASVFPYFFWSENGRIWITLPDETLERVLRGETVEFKGRALNDSGDERKIEGRATPTGPTGGKIRVRVIISKRIVLTYNSTYSLLGAPGAPQALTPKQAR
jgi:hypothetical protein